ncbi:hypothetical protein EU527_12620 [Candidatus Thorarchaeota archaeon]|nr:MAG: hypothetical protein EU527_12620 [Candidatus Thorarchaeota archaeon]
MIISGTSGAIAVLDELAEALSDVFGSSFVYTFESVMGILSIVTILAGVVTIIGGIVITTTKVWFGRVLLISGITAGVIGLMMSLVQVVMTGTLAMGMTMQLQQSVGWIGAMIAFIARIIAEQKSITQ